MTSEDRSGIENGIWLCQIHAKVIDDDEETYTVGLLQAWKDEAEQEATDNIGRPTRQRGKFVVDLSAGLQREPGGELMILGTTNLPDGTRLMLTLYRNGSPGSLGQARATVSAKAYAAPGFTDQGKPHHHGRYTIEVLGYFNAAWQQPQNVITLVGAEGARLAGPFVEPEDVDFPDIAKHVRKLFHLVAPPAGETADVDESVAITVVRDATLEVDGRRSAAPVGHVVDLFMQSPGLDPRDGWSATKQLDGSWRVVYSYWNGTPPATAAWGCIPSTGEVWFENYFGKLLSFVSE